MAGSPVCMPMRTRSTTPSGQRWAASARWACAAAATASLARAKATKKESPSVPTSRPSNWAKAARKQPPVLPEHLQVPVAQPLQ